MDVKILVKYWKTTTNVDKTMIAAMYKLQIGY